MTAVAPAARTPATNSSASLVLPIPASPSTTTTWPASSIDLYEPSSASHSGSLPTRGLGGERPALLVVSTGSLVEASASLRTGGRYSERTGRGGSSFSWPALQSRVVSTRVATPNSWSRTLTHSLYWRRAAARWL